MPQQRYPILNPGTRHFTAVADVNTPVITLANGAGGNLGATSPTNLSNNPAVIAAE